MSDTRNTRATAKLDSSPQSSANKMLMDEIRRLKADMITKKDLESIVKKVFDEKTSVLQETINENARTLQELHLKVDRQNKTVEKLEEKVLELEEALKEYKQIARVAYTTANKNEQYSRKNSFKINGIKELKQENTKEVAKKFLEKEIGVKVDDADIVAVHRIPGKAGESKPILVKLKNNMAKSNVMRKRSTLKKNSNGRHWLTDDVTKLNALLIKRLKEHSDIDNAWYFNGSVYGEKDGSRMKFDLFDEVEDKIRKRDM